MSDKTNYAQSLTHLIKGNMGAGMMAMPASFAHTGLVGATLGLPALCIICAYCVNILVKSSQLIESKSRKNYPADHEASGNYSNLARQACKMGPPWMRPLANPMGRLVDACLLVTQVGVCCVYIIFIVDNVTSILATYQIFITKTMGFLAILPITALLSFIKTLRRLAFASLLANLLQALGLALVVEYLVRDLDQVNLADRDNFRPLSETALGFGSAVFAFEGISVVLPLYSRMKNPKLMTGYVGVVNVAFAAILVLYYAVGLLGFLRYGKEVRDSITLNLPAEPLYDAVRAMFTLSILLSYPLQFYVPNEIVWDWTKRNLLTPTDRELSVMRAIEVVLPPPPQQQQLQQQQRTMMNGPTPPIPTPHNHQAEPNQQQHKATTAQGLEANGKTSMMENGQTNITTTSNTTYPSRVVTTLTDISNNKKGSIDTKASGQTFSFVDAHHLDVASRAIPPQYQYYCRFIMVMITFTLAFSVPKLNLLMDLIGSLSGVVLCLSIPAFIHMAAHWDTMKGFKRVTMVIVDSSIIALSLFAGAGGSLSSVFSIIKSYKH